jgi:hypothetical protein
MALTVMGALHSTFEPSVSDAMRGPSAAWVEAGAYPGEQYYGLK